MSQANVVPLHRPKATPAGPEQGRRRRRGFGTIRALPSGRYQASYLDREGQRHLAPVTFLTKGDAGAWIDMRHAELLEYRWKPAPPAEPENITFAAYAARWLAEREIKPRTRSEYQRFLDRRLIPAFGSAQLRLIQSSDVRDWYRSLDPSRPTERAHSYQLLSAVLNGAVLDELVDVNPCRIKGAAVVRRAHKIEPASVAELDAIASAMPERLQLAVLLGGWLALRYGEIAELRRKDVDVRRGVVRVRRGVTWPNGVATIGTPKSTAGIRDVHIPPHVIGTVSAHLDRHTGPGPDALLFPATRGGNMHPRTFGKLYDKARKEVGRPDLRFHDLRHTGAVMAARVGATLAELQARLGHSTATAAMRYQHASSDRDAEIARRLSTMAGAE